jgi:DNA polymerase-3 subunit alpha
MSMFDMMDAGEASGFVDVVPEPDGVEWDKRTKLHLEKEIMGIYVSEHPLAPYERAISRVTKHTMGELSEATKGIKNATFVGMISGVKFRQTKKGTNMANFSLEDTSGTCECITFDSDKWRDFIQEDMVVAVRGRFEVTDRGNQILVSEVKEFELDEGQADYAPPKSMQIAMQAAEFNQSVSLQMNRVLQEFPGRDNVVLLVTQQDGRRFEAELPIKVDSASGVLRNELCQILGRAV